MRSPSRFLAPVLSTALIALSFASAATAEDLEASEGSGPATTQVVDFDAAFASAAARMDERMNAALETSTTMDCRHDAQLGYETCTVTLEHAAAPEAPLASN